MPVDDYGIEVLKKAAEEITPGNKSAYQLLNRVTSSALPTGAATNATLEAVNTSTDTRYTSITENVNSQLLYYGRAATGSVTSDPVWQIYREYTIGTKTYLEYAGTGAFDQVWDDRTTIFSTPAFFNQYSTNFDGINDTVSFGTAFTNFDVGNAWSMSFWLNINNLTAQRCVYSKATNDVNVYGFSIQVTTGGNVFLQCRSTTYNLTHTGSIVLPTTAWTHLVVTYSGGSNINGMRIYSDAIVDTTPASGAMAATLYSGSQTALFGARGATTNPYSGYIDEVTFWNTALNASQISELYNSGSPADPTTHSATAFLLNWYRMGDNDTYNVISDNQGSTDGTMTNMAANDFETVVP